MKRITREEARMLAEWILSVAGEPTPELARRKSRRPEPLDLIGDILAIRWAATRGRRDG